MSCRHIGNAIVCSPEVTKAKKWRRRCPSCTFRATHVGYFYEWYGWHVTCLRCGEQWQDGEWLERPFMPRWRQRNIEAARKRWSSRAGTG